MQALAHSRHLQILKTVHDPKILRLISFIRDFDFPHKTKLFRELPVEQNSIQVELSWHPRYPLLSVGAYSEERGGYVRVIDTSLGGGLGLEEALPIPPHPTAQVSALAWHPIYKLLIGK